MESSLMLPFDSRMSTSAPLQRSVMPPHYIMAASYSSSPTSSVAASPYHAPALYHFGGYHGPPTPPQLFKQDFHERRTVGLGSENGRELPYARDTRPLQPGQLYSPARSDSQLSTARSVASNRSVTTARTITSNEPIHPGEHVDFDTEIDVLMRTIQKKAGKSVDAGQAPPTPGASPVPGVALDQINQLESDLKMLDQDVAQKPRKKYNCDGPNCSKSFYQKTHLDVHRRTHTGDKPYVCHFSGCNLAFSQPGNLKTHMRRHTGERPYKCGQCDQRFAQRGNVRAHEMIHDGIKPFICRLEGCNKTFSQLGNMKAHQNSFHKTLLQHLTSRFAQIIIAGKEVPEADRDLFEYFATHYKNSNKGIRGRGRERPPADRAARAVAPSPTSPPVSAQQPFPPAPLPQTPLPQIPPPQPAPLGPHHGYGLAHSGSLAAYSMSRGNVVAHGLPHVEHHVVYSMSGMDRHHTPMHTPSPATMMYENEGERQFAYNERLY